MYIYPPLSLPSLSPYLCLSLSLHPPYLCLSLLIPLCTEYVSLLVGQYGAVLSQSLDQRCLIVKQQFCCVDFIVVV